MRPQPGDYMPYMIHYIDLVPGDDLMKAFEITTNITFKYLDGIPEEKGNYSYAAGKWTIKQMLQHIIDAERVFGYRALTFARNDSTPLPGFEEDDWAAAARVKHISLKNMVEEFKVVRASTIALFRGFGEEELSRAGMASNNRVTVRALGFIILGHNIHHLNILKERYLVQSIA